MHAACDLLVTSTDSFLPEAMVTIGQLKRLGIAQQFDCHLLLGEASPEIAGFKVIHRARRGTWSSELRDGLLQLTKPYVLLWLDDFPPLGISSIGAIVGLVDAFVALGGNYLRLNPTPPGHGPEVLPHVRAILPNELYRTSTVYAIWRRETLLALLDDSETAWQFEFAGSARSERFDRFMASQRQHVDFVNLVIKGRVDPRAEARLKRAGVDTGSIVRPRMSSSELGRFRIGEFRSAVLRLAPWRLRRGIRHFFSTNPPTRR